MNYKSSTIDLTDYLSLVTVWELQEGYWELLTITRFRCAIALARESPLTRLVFPTGVKPHGVWGGIYKNRATPNNQKKADSLHSRQQRVLALLKQSPGQTRDAIASHLDVSVATTLQLLRHLEKSGGIHHYPHPVQNKTKLYYAGSSPSTTGTSANKNSSKEISDPWLCWIENGFMLENTRN
jgi:DNA-binding CsgD family transcriptional regulator